ncbi:MAG: NADH:ubiquinone reductase (Na(+)-transporting) subunit A [Deferribacterota bacterium]|nr:NADH:ubiquinone reductase (Na(+)-transporting) subunit A [Deferribacterota bacterium]
MTNITIKKGLNIPIKGAPKQVIDGRKESAYFAYLGSDFPLLKPSFLKREGDSIRSGEAIFYDKKNPNVKFISPFSGTLKNINRGEKRVLLSVVIEKDYSGKETNYNIGKLDNYTKDEIIELLIKSGLFISIKKRPFDSVANPEENPSSIIINAIDTRPLCPSTKVILDEYNEHFNIGLNVISKLSQKIFLTIPKNLDINVAQKNIRKIHFNNLHPAGLVGTQIFYLDPIKKGKLVWYIDYQHVIAIGHLFTTGRIKKDKIVALSGDEFKSPRLINVPIGAYLGDITKNELKDKNRTRIISGSPLYGHKGDGPLSYLGFYNNQITAIKDVSIRKFMGWALPGTNVYSTTKAFLSKFLSIKKYSFDTSLKGSHRPIIPIGIYEKVFPFKINATYFLKYLLVEDLDSLEKMGVLGLAEEDLSLVTFVCPGKIDYAPKLRKVLNTLAKEY